jgi:hypothetical protein
MKKLYVLLILASVPASIFFGCKHDPVLPEQQVSFSADILPIMQMGCSHAGCHGDSLNQMPQLTSYEEVMEFGQIEPGKPYESELFRRIIETDSTERMPRLPYAPLNDRNQKLIYIWIAQGAKDN